MRAAWYEQCGPATEVLQVGEMEKPRAGAGEVLVRVAVSGVNPVDVKRRLGGRGAMDSPRVIPHFDGAGVIDAVGEGVDAGRVGERVWLYGAQWQRDFGTAAEFVALPACQAVTLPDEVSDEEGACLGIPALTAHWAVFAGGEVRGETVLVTGAAGSVGRYAVQFAKGGGARVIGTVSGPEKEASACAAGADEVINYKTEDVARRVGELAGEVDRIVEVDFGANLPVSLQVLKVRGLINAYASEAVREPVLPFYEMMYRSLRLQHILTFQMPEEAQQRAVDDISRGLAAGTLSHQVGERYPLEDIAKAHEAVEAGTAGKVVLEIG